MNRIYSSPRCILFIFCLLFSFIGCGGGGGGSSSDGGGGGGGGGGNGSITYAGLTTPAAISEANAEDLVFGSLLGLEIGGSFSLSADSSGGKLVDKQGQNISIHPIAINLPLVLNNTSKKIFYAHSRKNSSISIASTETDTINGNCGGAAAYTINVNDTTGSYDGTFIFKQYCEDGIVISGDTDINGTLNLATGDIITITYVFDNLTVDELIFKGNIFVNDDVTPQIIKLDLLAKDSASDKVYWAKDYSILITEINATDIEMEVTGTYYDPDQGYVTVSTTEPFWVSIEDWPISGILLCVGDKNTKARLTAINDYSYRIEADTNGDDIYDFNSGDLIWPGATPPTPPTPPPGPQAWIQKTSIPTARYSLSAGAVADKIYAIGGQSALSDSFLATLEEYSPITNTWIAKEPMPKTRSAFAVGVVNGKIYAIGGRTFDPNTFTYPELSTVEEYDPVFNTWVTKSPMPTARWNFAAAVINGKIYAIGGQSGVSVIATVEEYDPSLDSWTVKAPMPTARRELSASVVNDKLYAIGGWTVFNENTEIVEEYDPGINAWTTKVNMPRKRFDHVSEAVNGAIFVFGGSTIPNNIVEKYLTASDQWTLKTPMPEGGERFAASVVNSKIYVIGVGDYSKVYEYDPSLDP